MSRADWRRLLIGLAFLSPNLVGFLVFTLVPLVLSLVLAFSNWDLKLHNQFKDTSIEFVGLANFTRLLREPQFWRFLGNTLFLMAAIPFAIAGSLLAAVLLSRDLSGGPRGRIWLLAGAVLLASCTLLAAAGAGGTALMILLTGVAGGILLAGVAGGTSVYRTLFYLPHFVTGVPTFLLWKKMYAPTNGPVNNALRPALDGVAATVQAMPAPLVAQGGMALAWLGASLLLGVSLRRMRRDWREGQIGWQSAWLLAGAALLPMIVGIVTWPSTFWRAALALTAVAGVVWCARPMKPELPSKPAEGMGTAVLLGMGLVVAELSLLGLGWVMFHLPAMAADGLEPPLWIYGYHWAKPALMLMGIWGAIGSNNMLLYLAALTNVPQHLYEAADLDGASRFQRFWHVTWPQLAPTTLFIVIMSTIGGIQGGFEMARTMTQGGPAGSTTTLSYFIYLEGFETGRLGYASAVAWVLLGIVLVLTLINWQIGNRYVNDE